MRAPGLAAGLAILLISEILLAYGLPLREVRAAGPLLVALVRSRTLEPYLQAEEGLEAVLSEAGVQTVFQRFDLQGDARAAPPIVALLQRTPPDLVLTFGSLATRELVAARNAEPTTRSLPLVFLQVLEPESLGLPAVGTRGSANVTGVALDLPARAQLEAVQAALPEARTVGVIHDPSESGRTLARLRMAAQPLGLSILAEAVQSEREVPRALERLSARADVLMATPDRTLTTDAAQRYLLLTSLRQAIPMLSWLESGVRGGALLGLTVNHRELGRQAGRIILRIRQGTPPDNLPTEEASHLRLLLNLRSARYLGLTLPPSVVARAEVLSP